MDEEQFNALYSVWKQLGAANFAFFVRVAVCCYDATLRFFACEYCTQACLQTSEATLQTFVESLLDLLAHEAATDRAEHLLALLEHLLCKLCVLCAPVGLHRQSYSQSQWKTIFSIAVPPTTATVSINGVACTLAPSLPFFLSFSGLFADHTTASRFPILYSVVGHRKTLLRPWDTPSTLPAASRIETEELPVNEKDYAWLTKEPRSPEFLAFFGMRMVRALMALQKSPVFSAFGEVMRRLLLELPLLLEEPFAGLLKAWE